MTRNQDRRAARGIAATRGARHPQPPAPLPESPCFTPGTRIATARGERLVEDLRAGDRVVTRDNGLQEIRWIGRRDFDGRELAANPHLNPVLIRAGALGGGLPERDMRLSPNHRIMVSSEQTALYFEDREVLAAAKHLVNNRGIFEVETVRTTYLHLLFDRHEVILSDGTWSESFQPADFTLRGIGNSQRQEILAIFPELGRPKGSDRFTPARRVLNRHEARRITDPS